MSNDRPKKRTSEDEDYLTGAADDVVLKSDLDIDCADEVEDYEEDGETEDEVQEDDTDSESEEEEVLKLGVDAEYFKNTDSESEEEKVLKLGVDAEYFKNTDSESEEEEVLKLGDDADYFKNTDSESEEEEVLKLRVDREEEEILKLGVDSHGIHDADSEEVHKGGNDLDGIHDSEMKCDSEVSSEMLVPFTREGCFSYVPRKARSSGPFVAGSTIFKDCDGNVINCFELFKQIRFDADSIDVIDSNNPMFILLVEKRSTAEDFYRELFARGYPCIIVATGSRSLYGYTKDFLWKLQKMSNLQVYALFDFSPHFVKIMSDLIHRGSMDLIWLGIQPRDVLALLDIEPEILTTPMTATDYNLFAQYQDLSHHSQYNCILEQLGQHIVRIKAFSTDTLIHYYLPKLLYGVPGF